ncbi:MAG: hypothetical protein U0936_15415 [Planctomycetaceae bacterium]
MTSSHGRRIQGRRALAIMAWVSLVIVAWLLWRGQHYRIIRVQAWEPAALLLSAYATFLAIFGWLLFSPGRASAEESPGLFFAGMLTLLPPCFIAYHLMPVGSPLKPWLTIGVFVFGIIAIMSPLPDEVFAIPRDRKSYLQPLTDAYLSELDVDAPQVRFDEVAPRTEYWLSRSAPTTTSSPGSTEARDPWADPFYGTGRQMSRIGVSQSRRSEEVPRSERRRVVDEQPESLSRTLELTPPPLPPMPVSAPANPQPYWGNLTPLPKPPVRSSESLPSSGSAGGQVSGTYSTSSRRPLTEPSGKTSSPVGFQAPVSSQAAANSQTSVGFQTPAQAARPVSPPPLPASSNSGVNQNVMNLPPVSMLPVTIPQPPVAPVHSVPLNPIMNSPALTAPMPSTIAPAFRPRPLSDPITDTPATARTPEQSLREFDRQIREQELLADEEEAVSEGFQEPVSTSARAPVSGVTRTVQHSNGDMLLERIRDEHGGEMVEGTIKVFFEVGQKRAHLHVPFSPPLAGLPEVECEPANDDQVRLKVAVRQPYGVRIEARRAEASESLRTEISFAAVYTPPTRRG